MAAPSKTDTQASADRAVLFYRELERIAIIESDVPPDTPANPSHQMMWINLYAARRELRGFAQKMLDAFNSSELASDKLVYQSYLGIIYRLIGSLEVATCEMTPARH